MKHILLALLLAGSGCLLGDPHPTEGPGQLLDSGSRTAKVGAMVTVPFDVQLVCGAGGPMRDLASATGEVIDPDGGITALTPTWHTEDRQTWDCTEDEWQRVAHVSETFQATSAGTWHAQVTLQNKVGTFGRDIIVTP